MSFFLRVFSYLARYPWLALGTIFSAISSTLMVAIFPAVTEQVIDAVLRQGHVERFVPLIALGLGGFFLQNFLNALRILLNNHFEQRVIFDLRSDLYSHLQFLPLSWFEKRTTGDILTRVIEDVTSVERALLDGIEQGTVSILQILIIGALMLFYSPLLTLAAFVPVPFLIVGALVYTFAGKKIYEREREAASSLGTILHDNLDGIRQIKTYTSEIREQLRFEEACNEVRHSMLAVMKAWAFYSPTMNFLGSLGMICILTVGVQSVLYHHMELGVLVAFLVLARYLYEPIDRLHSLHELLQAGRAAGNRLFSIIDEAPEPGYATAEKKRTAPQKCSLEGLQGEVEFRHVNFSYSQETPLLHNIALHAYPGQMIALVGPTGSGKSTLVNLLSRFYELTSGEIFFDGHSLRDLPLELLRHSIGMVTQESFLFNGSTADNLRIGRPEVTEEEMWNALKAANAAAFVERLPKGLYTALGERGIKLSVGEKQRISIARALLKNPPILVLDEATASVDNTTERLIQEALQRLLAGRTSFVIAHRLSTILQADQILVLDRGHIIERGTHETLLARQGLYAQLYQASLAK